MTPAARNCRADAIRDRAGAAHPDGPAGHSRGAKHESDEGMTGRMTDGRTGIRGRRPQRPPSYAAGYAGLSNSSSA